MMLLKDLWKDGVVYFADDDNAYHVDLFEELRKIKRIGILPVSSSRSS